MMSAADEALARAVPDFRLDGLRAVVTGAGRGIGRGCALALAACGAEVVAVSRTAAELEAVAEETGGTAVVCDVTDPRAVAERIGALAPIDVLVTCAGGNAPRPFLEVSPGELDSLLALNVKGTFLAAQAAARQMVAASGGAMVLVSSQMGRVGAPRRSVYCATKHAIEGLTRALAVELAPRGVRVNAVAPTFVETPMTRPFLADPDFRADVLARIPAGRLGTVTDVAAAVVFLASPAADLITGASVLVDGGWTAQ
jgi:NAD(P)-dependent dehydrogenase (short-subunit alcohol dehydrogenase family)